MNLSQTFDNNLIREVFSGLSIDKTRLPSSHLTKSGVPSFVGEWLLDKIVPGNGSLTHSDMTKLYEFVNKAFPRKDDVNVYNFRLSQGETVKIIALMQVRVILENKQGIIPEPIAKIPILQLNECRISAELVERYQKLLRQGVWGKITLAMQHDGKIEVIGFEPFECSQVDLGMYAECRRKFTTQEWKDLVFCSMGYNSEHPNYTEEAKTWMLARLLPLVESNYHVMELAPKGTGKSYVFENISNRVCLVSGGKVTPAQLFINGKTKEVGLLGRHDVLVLDEVQSITFDNPDEVIGPLKTYLASGRYNRSGFADIASDCSLVMLANIELTQDLKPKNRDHLMANLPKFFSETAFLDRFCGVIPGWKIPKYQQEMTAIQIGLKTDFFGEALLALRQDNRFFAYAKQHSKFQNIFGRDESAILKSAAGFLKILYPHLELTVMDFERDCLKPACELRQYIRNSQYHLDDEYKGREKNIYVEAI